MKITNVNVMLRKRNNDNIKATVSMVFDNCFVVNNIRVVNGKSGLFIAMPSEKDRDGNGFRDIAHPINSNFRKIVHETILAKYYEKVQQDELVEDEKANEKESKVEEKK